MDNRESTDRIKALIPSLPEGDAKLAHKFLNSRDFESLQFLVDSSLVRVKKGLSKENPKEEYLKDLGEMRKLKSEIDTYCEALELPEQEDEYEDFSIVRNTIKIITNGEEIFKKYILGCV